MILNSRHQHLSIGVIALCILTVDAIAQGPPAQCNERHIAFGYFSNCGAGGAWPAPDMRSCMGLDESDCVNSGPPNCAGAAEVTLLESTRCEDDSPEELCKTHCSDIWTIGGVIQLQSCATGDACEWDDVTGQCQPNPSLCTVIYGSFLPTSELCPCVIAS